MTIDDEATQAMRELAAAMRENTAELRRQRERKRSTKRQRAMRNASKPEAPAVVTDLAAVMARRALGKIGG